MAAAVSWFPVVGALVGAAVGGVAAGLGELVPMSVAAAVGRAVRRAVTGAFHEDGLADTADAVAGGWTVERRLEILKDPRHGSYGVAALCGSIVLRIVAVATLGPAAAFAGLVAAHALGRGAAVVTMGVAPVARADGPRRRLRPRRRAAAGRVAGGRRRRRHRRGGDRLVGRCRWRSAAAVGAVVRRRRRRPRARRRHRRRARRHRAGRRVPRPRRRHRAGVPPRPCGGPDPLGVHRDGPLTRWW